MAFLESGISKLMEDRMPFLLFSFILHAVLNNKTALLYIVNFAISTFLIFAY